MTWILVAGLVLAACGAVGLSVELNDGRSLICPRCDGRGLDVDDRFSQAPCPRCHGLQYVTRSRPALYGFGFALIVGTWLSALWLVAS